MFVLTFFRTRYFVTWLFSFDDSTVWMIYSNPEELHLSYYIVYVEKSYPVLMDTEFLKAQCGTLLSCDLQLVFNATTHFSKDVMNTNSDYKS